MSPIKLDAELRLSRCPHCGTANPLMENRWHELTRDFSGGGAAIWAVYSCSTCGKCVLATGDNWPGLTDEVYPDSDTELDDSIPERARVFLTEAANSAPNAAIMAVASAVDAMLKNKGYKDGSLYDRIGKAVGDHLFTPDMAAWAHEIRLDANAQRHPNEEVPLATPDDAKRTIEFAHALAVYLFVLPARIRHGRQTNTNSD